MFLITIERFKSEFIRNRINRRVCMAVHFNSFSSSSVLPFSFGETIVSSLTVLQQKVVAIAAIIFASLAICYAVIRLCRFKTENGFQETDQGRFDFEKKDPVSPYALNAFNHFESLRKRMGPLPSKYQPLQKELEKLEQVKEGKEILFSPSFTERYSGIKTVPEFFKEGFADALKKIYELTEQGKIKLNHSLGTPTSKGGSVVYRFLALDWIKEGKIVKTSHGYELCLNNEGIKLVSSLPENVLKLQRMNETDQLVIAVQFGARCDFIPGEEVLKHTFSAHGIDPIAAKCLWEKVSQEGKSHFLDWILEPAMEDDCAEYASAVIYIETLTKKQQEELFILRDLIDDLAGAVEAKFKHDIAMVEWKSYLETDDLELQPFVKKERDSMIDAQSGKNEMKNHFFTSWLLQKDILSGKKENGIATQPEFYQLIKHAQEVYQIYFNSLKSGLLHSPMNPGTIIASVSMKQLCHQYYFTHQLLSYHGCLLSNFLSVIVVEQKAITGENVDKLKIAMATYLDVPEHANAFEVALKNDFGCSVKKFKNWLRKKE